MILITDRWHLLKIEGPLDNFDRSIKITDF